MSYLLLGDGAVAFEVAQPFAGGPQELGNPAVGIGNTFDEFVVTQSFDLSIHRRLIEAEGLGQLLECHGAVFKATQQCIARTVQHPIGGMLGRAELVARKQGELALNVSDAVSVACLDGSHPSFLLCTPHSKTYVHHAHGV